MRSAHWTPDYVRETVYFQQTTRKVYSSGVTRAVESESEGILNAVGVGENVPTSTPTSIWNLK
jgi:hypothetical protein